MQKYTLITGATSGIGLEFARQLASKNQNLLLVSRSAKKLAETSKQLKEEFKDGGFTIQTLTADLSDDTQVSKLVVDIKERGFEIDFLINNAGVGRNSDFLTDDLNAQISMINLNVNNLVYLTGLLLPHLVKNKGKILNVASTAAFFPIPKMAVYAATKSFVLSFSEALKEELKGKVKVFALCPGATKTKFFEEANMEVSKNVEISMMTVEDLVKIALKQVENNNSLIVPGFLNNTMVFLKRFLPYSLLPKIANSVMNKK
jgi:short-subunit dehydrogenase